MESDSQKSNDWLGTFKAIKMDLFEQENDSTKNRLPYNGEVFFYGRLFGLEETTSYYNRLLKEIDWKHDEAIIFGKHTIPKTKKVHLPRVNLTFRQMK